MCANVADSFGETLGVNCLYDFFYKFVNPQSYVYRSFICPLLCSISSVLRDEIASDNLEKEYIHVHVGKFKTAYEKVQSRAEARN